MDLPKKPIPYLIRKTGTAGQHEYGVFDIAGLGRGTN